MTALPEMSFQTGSDLDFVQLSGITNGGNQAVKKSRGVFIVVYIHVCTYYDCGLMNDNDIYYHYAQNRTRPRSAMDLDRTRYSLA